MACWICFEECSKQENPLKSHCSCQYLLSHSKCIARWQVQQAGKREEKFCRFCDKEMPNWMDQMCGGKIKKGNPIMEFFYDGKKYKFAIEPGNFEHLKEQIRQIIGIDISKNFNIGFKVELNGEKLDLYGIESFDVASKCAAITHHMRKTY